jgi:PTH1 family peptidyl-tRNA hydrolase
VAWASWGDRRIALLKPTTYMNRSGDALARFRAGPPVDPGRHLVVLDDVALPFGAIRFRAGGSAGGHRGLQSVIDRLGTSDVPRLRLGVGGALEGVDLADHVLARFTADEEAALEPWLERAVEGVLTFIVEGPEAAMNRFNR